MSGDPVRPRLGDAVREAITPEYLEDLLAQIKGAVRGIYVDTEWECPHCHQVQRKKTKAEIPDWQKSLSALKDLIEQTEGKPGTLAVEDQGITLVVKRNWPVPSPDA